MVVFSFPAGRSGGMTRDARVGLGAGAITNGGTGTDGGGSAGPPSSPACRPHWTCAAPTNARTTKGASIGGGARLPSVVAALSATCLRVNRVGHGRTWGNSRPSRTASAQRPRAAQPVIARSPTLPNGLTRRRIAGGDARSIPNRARARAIADAEYHRRRNIARGTTSTTAPQGTQRKRRHATVRAAALPRASVGPSIHRVRRPCPCSRKLAPAGRLATWQAGHCRGRTSSGDGGLASHLLTSRSLCTIRLGLRSPSGIQPGPRWGRCSSTGPHHYFWSRDHPGPRPPPSAAAHYITPAARLQAPLADGPAISFRAPGHHEAGPPTPPSSAISSRGNSTCPSPGSAPSALRRSRPGLPGPVRADHGVRVGRLRVLAAGPRTAGRWRTSPRSRGR